MRKTFTHEHVVTGKTIAVLSITVPRKSVKNIIKITYNGDTIWQPKIKKPKK